MVARIRLCCTLLALLVAPLAIMPAAAQQAVTVGVALSQSGMLSDLGNELKNALLLWQEEVNAAGGLLGRRVELQMLDDKSDSGSAVRLYEQLIREHKADLLIGPLGSAATLGAAATAERNRRVLINATGVARNVHKAGTRYVFQVPPPLAAYGNAAIEAARSLGMQRLLLLAREDQASGEIAARARQVAVAAGMVASEVEPYQPGNADFAPQVARARALNADAWIAFGAAQDAAEMVKTFRRLDYAPRLFVAQGVANPEFIQHVGQDAEHAVGVSAYERRAPTRDNARFAQAYAKRWLAHPGPLAAEGYAAGRLLGDAVRQAGSFDQEKLRAVLAALDTETPLGRYKVDANGAQEGARPLLVQIQRGRREIVWPEALATAKWQPYPAWKERKPIR